MSDILSHISKLFNRKSLRVFSLRIVTFIAIAGLASSTMATSFNNPLVDAADMGDAELVSRLITEGNLPDSKGDFGTTALMRAAFRGNLTIIQILMESGAYVNAADIGGETALHLAAKNGNVEVVKSLIHYGAYIDVPDKEQWTPLMRATLAKEPEVVKELLDKGADINALNSIHESALVHSAIAGIPEITKMIISNPKAKKIPKEQEVMAVNIAKRKKHEAVEKSISEFMDGETKPTTLAGETKSTDKKSAPESVAEKITTEKPIPELPSLKADNPDLDKFSKIIANKTETTPANTKDSAGIFFVQLGNFKDTHAAEAAWDKVSSANKSALATLSPKIIKANSATPNESIYRLRAGTITNRTNADSTCKSISEKGFECYVVEVNNSNEKDSAKATDPAPALDKYTAEYLTPVTSASATTPPTDISKAISSLAKPAPTASPPPSNLASNYPKLAEAPSVEAPKLADNTAPVDIDPALHTGNINSRSPLGSSSQVIKTTPISPMNQSTGPKIEYSYPNSTPKTYPPLLAPESTPSVNSPINSTPITPFPMPAQSIPEDSEFAANKEKARNEIQEMTRQNFYKKQGVTPPERSKKEYDDFYKQMQSNGTKERSVSEAVLVPDETYFAENRQSSPAGNSSGAWITVGNLPSEEFANDYGTRMFKKDESLGNVQVIIMKPVGASPQQSVSMKVGPLAANQTDNLCKAVIAGGFACTQSGGGSPVSSYSASINNSKRPPADNSDNPFAPAIEPDKISEYWINLGTFASNSEAEYYWMFIKEDNSDILNNMKYSMTKAKNSGNLDESAVSLKTGPFSAKQRASQLCNIMRYRNIACLVGE